MKPLFRPRSVALVATLSPAPGDLIHSLYSLQTVSLMAPGLGDTTRSSVATQRLAAELRMGTSGPADFDDPLTWSPETTNRWLLTAENSKFAHVVLPPGTTGKDLLSLDAKNLGALFEGQGRAGRADHEGSMWIVQADTDATLARQIASALKKEACKWRLD